MSRPQIYKGTERERKTQAQWKYKRTEKGKLTQSRYYCSEAKRESSKRYWRKPQNRIKHIAHRIFNYNVKIGKIARQKCETCGKPYAFGHHDDYSKPLKIKWMCNFHHSEYHRNLI